jgi:mannose-6-phosphate isomerase-like protein (cupin superfamily)
MRRTLFLFATLVWTSAALSAQTAPTPQTAAPTPQTPAPRPPRPSTAKPAVTAKPATVIIQVTDPQGAPLGDTVVAASGTVDRGGTTAPDGSLRLVNMRPGNYRLRFTREGSITLEREITLRAGESLNVDVALAAAPPPPKAPEMPPPPPSKTLGPPGDPKVTPVPLFLERNFIGGREGRKDSALGCTDTGLATLHQLRDSWLGHSHDDADEWIYVVAGEGTLRIDAQEHRLQAGTFSLVPHTVSHALIPQGRNPLIVISVLSGAPCAP